MTKKRKRKRNTCSKSDKEKIKNLANSYKDFADSGKTLSDFIRERICIEYSITGDDDLKDIASEYFLDQLDD